MSINSINPNPQMQLAANTQANPAPNGTPVKNQTNTKSKYIIGAAAAVGIAAVVIGGILAKKNISTSKLLSESKALQKQAGEILTESDKVARQATNLFEEVKSIIQDGAQCGFIETVDGNVTRKFIVNDLGIPQALEETGATGELLRRTKILLTDDGNINSCIPKTIEEFLENNSSNIYDFDLFKGSYSAQIGVSKNKGGLVTGIKKTFNFDYDWNDNRYFLSSFRENYKTNPKSGRETTDKVFHFNKNMLNKVFTSHDGINKNNFIYQNCFNYDNNGNLENVLEKVTSEKDFSKIFQINSDGKLEYVAQPPKNYTADI